MPAPKGNDYYKLADWGKPPSYEPVPLWDKFRDYVINSQDNPWHKNEAVKSGDNVGMIIKVPTERPLTIQGFCIFAEISSQTFYNYEKDKAYVEITARIRDIIYSQKFEGAAVGVFNANIIARDLGLSDKSEVDQKTEHSGVIKFSGIKMVRPDDPGEGVHP
jgi:hypothetical protein